MNRTGEPAFSTETPDFWIHAGWLVDGTGGPVQQKVRIRIREGLIHGIFHGTSHPPTDLPVLDFSGCTLLPGLVDAHVHLFMSGTADPAQRIAQLDAAYEPAAAVIRSHLAQHLASGVVAVRDGGDGRGHVLRFARSEPAAGRRFPPLIRVSGRAWRNHGRYGKLIGRTPAPGVSLAQSIRSDTEPADQIKIVNSGLNSLEQFGRQTPPQFTQTEMTHAVAAAAEKGRCIMVHANGEAPVAISVEAGCASIEHGFFMGRENLCRMAEKGVTWVPTACTMAAYAENVQGRGREGDIARKNLNHQLQQIAWAKDLGVSIAVGTDAGSLGVHHGTSVVAEMRLLQQAGFSPEAAVACCCRNGARLLGMHRTGSLVPGWEATCTVVDAGPDRLWDKMASPAAVFVKGRRVQWAAKTDRTLQSR